MEVNGNYTKLEWKRIHQPVPGQPERSECGAGAGESQWVQCIRRWKQRMCGRAVSMGETDLVGTELRILQSSKRRNSCGTNKICDIAEQ